MKIIYLLTLVAFLALPTILLSQVGNTTLVKEKFNLNREMEDAIGYAQAVKVGNTLYISGTASWGPMKEALKNAYDNIEKTLKAYNADFSNVVKENLYSTQLDSAIKYKDVRLSYYGNDFPSATWVEVKRLYVPDLVVEIEVIAILNEIE
jgi:2-iminobutanoate/2-iminopropanoate deaminase